MSSPDEFLPFPTIAQHYQNLVETGAITQDPEQLKVVAALDVLITQIRERPAPRKASALSWLFGRKRKAQEPMIGLYIHGQVGRGKSMLMDLFFQQAPAEAKRRAHFNEFMTDVHDRIAEHRRLFKDGKVKEADPIPPIAAALAQDAWVLCFDEFTVTDIADAMILSRLFSALFNEGVVLVATSNVMPDNLYKDGLNRGLFLPFIDILKKHVAVQELDADTDYRMEKLERVPVYLTPLNAHNRALMEQNWQETTDGAKESTKTLIVLGRTLVIQRHVGRAARFTFAELCEAAHSARDFLAIAAAFDTIFIDNVPVMDLAQRNAAKRFILLIDTLYEAKSRLVLSAAAEPEGLYLATSGIEAFEFARTASRLAEMQSRDWLGAQEGASTDIPTPPET